MPAFRPDPKILQKHPNAVTVPQLQHRDRFIGALLGLAAGEAASGAESGGLDLALAVLRSAGTRRKLDLGDVAQAMLRWFAGAKNVPDLTRSALENLRAGESHEQSGAMAWEDAGRNAPHNGSLVWVGVPVGLMHSKDIEGLADEAAALSRITHHDPRSVAGCVALATAVSLLVRGEKDAEEAIPRAAQAASPFSDDALMAIERGAAKKPEDVSADERGDVLTTLQLAFSALASAASFEQGVQAVVARGGDAAINGAVAGALLGAKLGKNQVPEKWVKQAKAANELASLGEAMHKAL